MDREAPVAAGDDKGSNSSRHKGSADNAADVTETAPNDHRSLKKNIPMLIHTPRSNKTDDQYSMEQHIQRRLAFGRAIEPTVRHDEAGCASPSTKDNDDTDSVLIHTRIPTASGDATVTFLSANKDNEVASNASDDDAVTFLSMKNNDDIQENDKPNSIHVVSADAAALVAARNVKDEGREGEEDRRQLPIKAASVSSASPHVPKSMLGVVRHVASSHDGMIHGAPLLIRTAETGIAKKDETTKETEIEFDNKDVADAGILAADPALEAAIATTAPTDNNLATVDGGSSLLSGFASVSKSSGTEHHTKFMPPLPPIQRYSRDDGMLHRAKKKKSRGVTKTTSQRIEMVRVDVDRDRVSFVTDD